MSIYPPFSLSCVSEDMATMASAGEWKFSNSDHVTPPSSEKEKLKPFALYDVAGQ